MALRIRCASCANAPGRQQGVAPTASRGGSALRAVTSSCRGRPLPCRTTCSARDSDLGGLTGACVGSLPPPNAGQAWHPAAVGGRPTAFLGSTSSSSCRTITANAFRASRSVSSRGCGFPPGIKPSRSIRSRHSRASWCASHACVSKRQARARHRQRIAPPFRPTVAVRSGPGARVLAWPSS